MESYSQCGQDLFVFNIMDQKMGTFLDLGCYHPKKINNTYLLELNGWSGISMNIMDYNEMWKVRKNKFIQGDCLNIDLKELLDSNYTSNLIDYMTLDMEQLGDRFTLLSKVMSLGYKFKVITIEHDSHIGNDYVNREKVPQRELLQKLGYVLVCSDVSQRDHPLSFYEDWWVNPEFFTSETIDKWKSDRLSCDKILEKLNIKYEIHDESKSW
jgi:hypothetical protein